VSPKLQDVKDHPFQILAMVQLSDGRLAVSGGPHRHEILIYNHLMARRDLSQPGASGGRNDQLSLVDSLDTQGIQIQHILEVFKQYIIAVGP
jgi:hypothetical protein